MGGKPRTATGAGAGELSDGVEGSPERLSTQELHDRAWPLVEPHFLEARAKTAALYRQLAGTGRSTSDLMQIVPKKEWTMFGHRMIQHGRVVCHARRPLCEQCGLTKLCPRVGVKEPPAEENCA